MQPWKILQIVRHRRTGWFAAGIRVTEPLDHPSLRGMSWRELADLPLERRERADDMESGCTCSGDRAEAPDRERPAAPVSGR